jgi:tRNA A-37 threonylcarbamoyl transferase component Bud32
VDAATGEQQWRFETGDPVWSSPAVADGIVFVGSNDHNLYAMDAATGEQQWRFETGEKILSSPTVVDGTVFVGSDDNNLYAVHVSSMPADETPAVAKPKNQENLIQTTPELELVESDSSETDLTDSDNSTSASTTEKRWSMPPVPALSLSYERFEQREPLGKGGNADVYRVTVEAADGPVEIAVKEPRMLGTLHIDAGKRLLEEAETWEKLDAHDHIVGVLDYGSEPVPWIAMEYMDGGHLGERGPRLDFDQALGTAIAIARGVTYAHHRGVAHLDLKPENVLFRSATDGWDVPKVADWGLSKHLFDQSKSIEGYSPQYAAPEQFDDSFGNPDHVTDIYQLGAVFYELFTGQAVFEGQTGRVIADVLAEKPTPPSDVADVPGDLDYILLRALAKDKSDRYETVVNLRNDLQALGDRD